jgi:hypothetical protein
MKLSNPFNCCRTDVHLQVVIPQRHPDFQVIANTITVNETLLDAIRNNNYGAAKKALGRGASLIYRNIDGYNAMDLGAELNNKEITELIIQFKMLRYECDRAMVSRINVENI